MKKLLVTLCVFVTAIALGLALLSSPPVTFKIEIDEPIAAGTLTLNGQSARLIKDVDGTYRAEWDGGDADGRIDLIYPDGGRSSCHIGYLTHSMGPQSVLVRKRVCRWTPTINNR